jgi:hypothetical protein
MRELYERGVARLPGRGGLGETGRAYMERKVGEVTRRALRAYHAFILQFKQSTLRPA